jgi:hypothetical protein
MKKEITLHEFKSLTKEEVLSDRCNAYDFIDFEEKEIWKSVKGYEDIYEVSNFGNIKSLGKSKEKKEKIFKGTFRKGYLCATLRKNNIAKIYLVHRLVAIAFIKNTDNKKQVNHKNGIKSDNNVDNLEWNTAFENMQHASFNNLLNVRKSDNHYATKLTEDKKVELLSLKNKFTQRELANMFNVTQPLISNFFKNNL